MQTGLVHHLGDLLADVFNCCAFFFNEAFPALARKLADSVKPVLFQFAAFIFVQEGCSADLVARGKAKQPTRML